MKLIDAARSVKKENFNETWADISLFCQELGLQDVSGGYNKEWDKRVKGYYLVNWLCTDTTVGICAYFLDDELVAVSYQSARKSDEALRFVSESCALKVKDYIQNLEKLESPAPYTTLDHGEEIDLYFSVDYSAQVQVDEGMYQGQVVKVKEKYRGYNCDKSKGLTMTQIKVELPDSSELVIPCNEFKIKININ